jgi:hypothetical protein
MDTKMLDLTKLLTYSKKRRFVLYPRKTWSTLDHAQGLILHADADDEICDDPLIISLD